MAITLLQTNSFMFDEQAVINKFNINNRLGIDCVLECIDKKLLMSDKLQHHVLFLKGRTGSGKSTCMPSRLFKHLDTNKGEEKTKIIINVVEPRVLLAQSISQDNCDNEPYLKFGINTGYYTGAGKTDIQGPSKLVYMTTDLFRMKLNKGIGLGDIVVIDECHILDRPTISTLHEIKKYLYSTNIPITRKPLFIFASATLNLDLMVNYFFGESEISSLSKIKIQDIYQDALMINHITGLRNFNVEESYIDDKQEEEFKHDEKSFVKYILTEGIEKSMNSKEKWKELPARDILIFSYGMGFNKLFEEIDMNENENKMKGGNSENEINEIEHKLNDISNELDKYLENMNFNDELLNENENENMNENENENENITKDENESENKSENESENINENEIISEFKQQAGNSKYPMFISTMKYDDSQEVKKWRNENKGKFRILILPYGTTCKGFASQLLAAAFDPDYDSQQYEIKIYISTDAIETGKTVNTWYQVYDIGLRLSKIINPLLFNPNQKQFLTRHPITQSASIQRCGRVGRKCPGISIRVFTKQTWGEMSVDSLPDNVNLVSIAQLNLECRKDEDKYADCVKYNDYIQPNSFDTNLVTGRDLVCSGYTTPWGEYINDVREYREPVAPWILKAEELYYLNNSDLLEVLMLCRNSRQTITDLLSASRFEQKLLPDDMNDVDNGTVVSVYEARQEYVKYLIGESKIFKDIK